MLELYLTPYDEICVVSFDILIIYYLSTLNLHEMLEFVYLETTHSHLLST
jgi:hypothetical protein